jgi:GT2 family glycosyltransferase
MDLSVIIVNYRSAPLAVNCLKSIYDHTKDIRYEVIVVDNASGDDSRQIICEAFPDIRWIQSQYNAGFARANNMGIRTATGRNILLLNADTLIQGNALGETVKLFDTQPQYAACGLQLLNTDGSPQHSGARFIKGGLNNLLPLPYLGKWLRNLAFSSGVKQPNVFEVTQNVEVDWIVGAFLMTKKETIESAGMLDEDFFMYAEEIELCSRLRRLGPLVLYHSPKVVHLGGGSSGNYYGMTTYDNSRDLWSRKALQILLSQFLRIRKQWGLFWFVIQFMVYIMEIPLFGFILALKTILRVNRENYHWGQWKGYTYNMLRLLSYFPSLTLHVHRFYKIS